MDAWFGRLTLPPKVEFWLESRLSAAEGRFGRRKCLTFVSGEGLSAAEGAAESALSSLFMVVFYACLSDVLGDFWVVVYELFRVCLAPHSSPPV